MPLQRKQFWDTRAYDEFLSSRAKSPFVWGVNDCATFASDGILAITDTDIMTDLRGYTTNVGAMQKIVDVAGGTSLADGVVYCAQKFGLTEREHPRTAQRGDLVLYKNADGDLAAGLVHTNGRHIVSPGESGLLRISITAATRSWTY